MQRRYTVWVDLEGRTRLCLLNSTAGCAGVEAALASLSHADVLNSIDAALTVNGAPAPSAGAYQRVIDSAQLLYADAGGNVVTVQLVAPVSTVFLADGETVDPVAIATLTAAIIGTILTPAGGLVTAFLGGMRRPSQKEVY